VDLDLTQDRERFTSALSLVGGLLPDYASPPEQLRGYLFVDDIDVLERAVHILLPTCIRAWAMSSAKAHRLRWSTRAEWFEALPPVVTWPTEASSGRGRDGNFYLMRVYRRMPVGWDEMRSRLLGTGDLGWLFCWIEQMTKNAAWIERIKSWPLIRHEYLPDCLPYAAGLIGSEEAHRLLFG
jgi:hypothetical protein